MHVKDLVTIKSLLQFALDNNISLDTPLVGIEYDEDEDESCGRLFTDIDVNYGEQDFPIIELY